MKLDKKTIGQVSAFLVMIAGLSFVTPIVSTILTNQIFGIQLNILLGILLALISFNIFKQS